MKTKFGQTALHTGRATIWKSLPNDCRTAKTFPIFKMKVKAMLAQPHLFSSLSSVLLFLSFSSIL